jgi:hypothetical protein
MDTSVRIKFVQTNNLLFFLNILYVKTLRWVQANECHPNTLYRKSVKFVE